MQAIIDFFTQTGFYQLFQPGNWTSLIMILIAFVLLYLAIGKSFEPLLLIPIAFGMLCTNQVTGEKAFAWSGKEIEIAGRERAD